MRLLTSREALIEKWALIGTTLVYRIITECLFGMPFLLSNFTNAANLRGGGGVRFSCLEKKLFLFFENHSISLTERTVI